MWSQSYYPGGLHHSCHHPILRRRQTLSLSERYKPMKRIAAAALLIVIGTRTHAASLSPDAALCKAAISTTEQQSHLPTRMLGAIGLVESGRLDPVAGVPTPWPWTINIAGVGHFFDTKLDAIAAVKTAQQTGIQSIDVGCMQINLMYHSHAFASLEDAFDPAANTHYAASFLHQLHDQTKSWGAAVAAYHSFTPERGADYGRRVAAMWPLGVSYGLPVGPSPVDVTKAQPAGPEIDPAHVFTPEFRAKLLQEAAFRRDRDAAIGPAKPPGSAIMLSRQAHRRPAKSTRRGVMQAQLDE